MLKDFYMKLSKKFRCGFTLTELVLAMIILTLIVLVTLPVTRKKMEKVDYFAYYMAYTTIQDISANIIAQNSYNIDNIAFLNKLKKGFCYLNASSNVSIQCPQCYVYSTVQNKCVPVNYKCEPTLYEPEETPKLDKDLSCTGTCYVHYIDVGQEDQYLYSDTFYDITSELCASYGAESCGYNCVGEPEWIPNASCTELPIDPPVEPPVEPEEPDTPPINPPDDDEENPPLTAMQLCEAIKSKYNISASDCSVSVATVNTAIESDTLGTIEPHITLSNGLRLYIATEAESISQLSDAEKAERVGYTLYVDANGKSGKSLIYQDIFPFYMLLSGKVIPGYNPAIVAGALNHDNLSINVLYDDYSNNKREVKFLLKDANFRRAACATGYVTSTTYCGDKVKYDKCKVPENDCRFMIKKPFKIF